MPTVRGALAAVVFRGKIYAFGGATESRNRAATEVYDLDADTWQGVAPLPTGRDHHAAAEADGKIYVIGGRLNGSYTRNLGLVEEYDPAANVWRRRAPMSTVRSGIGPVALNGRIYVVGGESPEGTFAQVEIFDPASDTWGRAPDLPLPRHGLGVVALGGRLYTLAGGPTPEAPPVPRWKSSRPESPRSFRHSSDRIRETRSQEVGGYPCVSLAG